MAALMLLAPGAALADGGSVTCSDTGGTRTVYAPLGLNLRSGPGLTQTILGGLLNEEIVTVLSCGEWSDGILWANVSVTRDYWTTEGWAAAAYMSNYAGYTEPYDSYEGDTGCKVTAGALRLRAEPSLEGAILAVMPYGTILQDAGGERIKADEYTWMEVTLGEMSAWAASEYLSCFSASK